MIFLVKPHKTSIYSWFSFPWMMVSRKCHKKRCFFLPEVILGTLKVTGMRMGPPGISVPGPTPGAIPFKRGEKRQKIWKNGDYGSYSHLFISFPYQCPTSLVALQLHISTSRATTGVIPRPFGRVDARSMARPGVHHPRPGGSARAAKPSPTGDPIRPIDGQFTVYQFIPLDNPSVS